MIEWSAEQEAEMRRHGEREYPLECCGVLLGEKRDGVSTVHEVRPLINENRENPRRAFAVASNVMRELLREERRTGQAILGFYHSHPDCPAIPSETDLENAWEGWATVILSVINGQADKLTAWNYDETKNVFHREPIHSSKSPDERSA